MNVSDRALESLCKKVGVECPDFANYVDIYKSIEDRLDETWVKSGVEPKTESQGTKITVKSSWEHIASVMRDDEDFAMAVFSHLASPCQGEDVPYVTSLKIAKRLCSLLFKIDVSHISDPLIREYLETELEEVRGKS